MAANSESSSHRAVVLCCRDVSAVALATAQGFPQGVCLGTSLRG